MPIPPYFLRILKIAAVRAKTIENPDGICYHMAYTTKNREKRIDEKQNQAC
jgi:hypothetical protein